MSKTAVILFNLGGPDSLKAVKPFLLNLFNDPAILTFPQPLRYLLAQVIATLRHKKAQSIYQYMGGKSPLLAQTMAQSEALEKMLQSKKKKADQEFKVFVCMRYWHPMSDVVIKKVKSYAPDRIILLPLYPQFSTTTTGSSLADWEKAAKKEGVNIPTSSICCYPADRSFVAAHVKLIKDMYWKASEHGKPRVLFSAHGLPEKVIAGGDPYQWQVERSVSAITQVLAIDELDYTICYQGKVGRLEWIGPSVEEEITDAARDNVPVLVVPVSFVSEHSETLVELDVDYRKLAEAKGVPGYYRVQALATEEFFIESLCDLCLNAAPEEQTASFTRERFCPGNFSKCACNA
jgi:protoporphyrin/coproporphyrin ferrochelatase